MLSLPPLSSPARNLIDVAHLVDVFSLDNRHRLRTYRQAVASARDEIARSPAIRSIHTVCVCADGTLRLIRVGPNGGVKRLWRFGKI